MKLIIAEKPSLARTVAKVIGIIKDNRSAGHIVCKDDYVVTWVFGHIIELVKPEKYDPSFKSWDINLLPIIPSTWQYEVKPDAKEQFNNIKTLLKSATTVINCGDPDREGQLLIDELLLHLKVKLPTKRLLILDPKDAAIRKAIENMEDNDKYYSWYQAGLLRSQADWLIGYNMTRAFSQLGRHIGIDGTLTAGRVQTPVLKLIYDRYLAIKNYKPLSFYNLVAEFTTNSSESFTAKLDLKTANLTLDNDGRLLSDNNLKTIVNKINGKSGTINEYEVKAGETSPPSLFKLSDLQAVANAKLGLSADDTLKIAQSLYEKQLTTYPRTACAYLPESLHADAAKIVPTLIPTFITAVQMDHDLVDINIKSKAFDDKKLDGESHFAIIPTGETRGLNDLLEKEFELYHLIGMQYLAQFMSNIKFEQTTGTVICEGYKFNFSGKVIKSLGWKEMFIKNNLLMKQKDDDDSNDQDAQKLPLLSLGQNVKHSSHNIQKSTTTKPKPYTDGTLVKAMANIHNQLDEIIKTYYPNSEQAKEMSERYRKVLKDTAGLGTEATRAKTIKSLKEKPREFVTTNGKNIEITDKGVQYMELLTQGKNLSEFSTFTSPLTTAIYEQQLDQILNHKFTAEQFNTNLHKLLNDKISNIKNKISTSAPAKPPAKATGNKCPECGSNIVERKGKFGMFETCSNYPKCKWMPPKVEKKPIRTGMKCLKCGAEMYQKIGKKGIFFGCSKYPECDFILK